MGLETIGLAALVFVIGMVLAGGLLFLYQQLRGIRFELSRELSSNLTNVLQKPLMDLTERNTRVATEMRDSIMERLSKNILESQERMDRSLTQNRQELQNGLAQGREELQGGLLKTTHALETKFQSLEQQVGIRLETIGQNVESKLNENLKEGFKHFAKIQEHLSSAELKLASLNVVGQSISDLNQLLKLPHLRGGFGEATLERLLADFLPTGSYELQYAVVPNSLEKVDAIVRFARQVLPIDSKFPRDQLLPLFDSQDPGDVETARKALSDFIKEQSKAIADKYIRPDHGTTDMALLFLPSETLYFEIIRNGKLFEYMTRLKVYPVSPNTLAISLNSVSMAQEYYEMARGVEQTIEDVKKARRHFEHFEKKFEEIGKGLKKAQEAFETANTHLGRYENSVFRLIGEVEEKDAGVKLPAMGVQDSLPIQS